MAVVSNIGLLDTLRQTRLLNAEQIVRIQRYAANCRVDARSLARSLVQEGWLTVYQINQLLAGKGQELVIGPYQVLDRLGQGGQSTVFQAKNTDTEQVVALKVIRNELLNNPEACHQFMQEMEAMATLSHPNVVQFLDADKLDDTFYCALEFVEGTDLGKYVRLTGPLPAAEACDYIRQTALGLQHSHERNIIHRDIKPVNLYLTTASNKKAVPLLGTGSVIKILDWGLACLDRRRERLPDDELSSSTRAIIGTADYLSPEQALHPQGVDIRSDLYSLGCTFYYLLTGKPPFPEGRIMQKLIKHQEEEPKPVDDLRPDLPLGLASIVKRMLAKRPEDRYQTPGSLAVALTPYCHLDRFLLPCLNREIRRRLGLDPDPSPQPPMPDSTKDASSAFVPHGQADSTNSMDTLPDVLAK